MCESNFLLVWFNLSHILCFLRGDLRVIVNCSPPVRNLASTRAHYKAKIWNSSRSLLLLAVIPQRELTWDSIQNLLIPQIFLITVDGLDHKIRQLVPQLEPVTETYFVPGFIQNWQTSWSPDKWVKQYNPNVIYIYFLQNSRRHTKTSVFS